MGEKRFISVVQFSVVCRSVTQSYLTLCDQELQHARLPLSLSNSQSSLKLMSIELVMPSNHVILCCHLLLLPSIFPSIRVFSSHLFAWGGQRIGASSSASNFQWIFRVDFLWDWLICSPCCPRDSQEYSPTPQFKSISSLVLSLLYGQLSHLYMTTEKNIALTIWTFVGKVMTLFFNMPSRFVITFLPRRKNLFISWLQSPFAVILYSHCIFKCILSPVSRFQSCLLDLAVHLLTKKLNSLNEDRPWTLSHWCYLSNHVN